MWLCGQNNVFQFVTVWGMRSSVVWSQYMLICNVSRLRGDEKDEE